MFGVLLVILLTPAMDRWGASDEEVTGTLPGDELVQHPASQVTRAVTIRATPEQLYPWLLQMGAGRGGLYSYAWLDKLLLRCLMVNADSVHPEWQDLKVGDQVKMCTNDPAPPPYVVAELHANKVVILGHQENGKWVDLWQFVIEGKEDGTSRLILRTRTMMTGGFWTVIHPGIFIMERGMLLGIKSRVERVGA